ncbi:MAG: YkuS family protein [Alicyclobacillus sp.]|nr:YkuS family protein [Alicyclobacillus sp.]
MNTVAVERGLDPVKAYLQSQGCQVVDLDSSQGHTPNADCICITGADKNVMGMQDVVADCPVVSCDGLSPEQVYERVKAYLQ